MQDYVFTLHWRYTVSANAYKDVEKFKIDKTV